MKVRVLYHGIEVETVLPDVAGEFEQDNAGFTKTKVPYPFNFEDTTAAGIAMELIDASVEAIQKLREGQSHE